MSILIAWLLIKLWDCSADSCSNPQVDYRAKSGRSCNLSTDKVMSKLFKTDLKIVCAFSGGIKEVYYVSHAFFKNCELQ